MLLKTKGRCGDQGWKAGISLKIKVIARLGGNNECLGKGGGPFEAETVLLDLLFGVRNTCY
jgi:hypothetical protein